MTHEDAAVQLVKEELAKAERRHAAEWQARLAGGLDLLTELYRIDRVTVAELCDEHLDRSGNLLGIIRQRAAQSREDQ